MSEIVGRLAFDSNGDLVALDPETGEVIPVPFDEIDADAVDHDKTRNRTHEGDTLAPQSLAAAEELGLPVVADPANGPQTQGRSIYVDGSGNAAAGLYIHDGNSYQRLSRWTRDGNGALTPAGGGPVSVDSLAVGGQPHLFGSELELRKTVNGSSATLNFDQSYEEIWLYIENVANGSGDLLLSEINGSSFTTEGFDMNGTGGFDIQAILGKNRSDRTPSILVWFPKILGKTQINLITQSRGSPGVDGYQARNNLQPLNSLTIESSAAENVKFTAEVWARNP